MYTAEEVCVVYTLVLVSIIAWWEANTPKSMLIKLYFINCHVYAIVASCVQKPNMRVISENCCFLAA